MAESTSTSYLIRSSRFLLFVIIFSSGERVAFTFTILEFLGGVARKSLVFPTLRRFSAAGGAGLLVSVSMYVS